MVENASKQSREQAMKRSARARTSTPERNDDSRRATFKRTTETPVRKTLAMPTSGGKAGPENPGSAAGAAALNMYMYNPTPMSSKATSKELYKEHRCDCIGNYYFTLCPRMLFDMWSIPPRNSIGSSVWR